MGFLQDAVTLVTSTLTAANIPNAHDPGAIRPKCVMVELPDFTTYARHVRDVNVRIRVCGVPPGNATTNTWIMNTVQAILNTTIVVSGGSPGTADYGGQQLPTYDMTCRIGNHQ